MTENIEQADKKYTIFDCESKFLNLFGYEVIGPNGSNRYKIVNQEKEEVGYIQYKKFQTKNIKKGIPAIYGYTMEIDSQKIKCKRTRKEDVGLSNKSYKVTINQR